MKIWIFLVVAALAAGYAHSCGVCTTMKWGKCDGTAADCKCTIQVNDGATFRNQLLDCEKLIPKCFLMQTEMYRAKNNMTTRSLSDKPDETAFVDNDGIYDPVCETDGKFKAKQCNNTKECWCVNSAGVRRTEKEGEDLVCEELVETYWVQLRLRHKQLNSGAPKPTKEKLRDAIKATMKERYFFDSATLVKDEVEYDPESRWLAINVKKAMGDRTINLAHMAYYMEKDVKLLPLFNEQKKFEPVVDGNKLEFEDILVYYVDEKPPTFVMKNLSGGIIAVIVVVVLVVVAGLLFLFFYTRRQRYSRAKQNDTS